MMTSDNSALGEVSVKAKHLLFITALSALLLSACSQEKSVVAPPVKNSQVVTESTSDSPPTPPSTHPAPTDTTAQARWITLPEHLRLPSQTSVEIASSWEARIAKLPQADQHYLKEANERFFGSLAFADEAEQRRLIEQGFPMPEEWLAARALSDVALERLAKAGNLKAQMLWVDRVSVRLAPIRAKRGLDDTPEDQELFRQFVESSQMSDQMLRTSPSPFAVYLNGRLYSAGSQGNSPEFIAGGFLLAKELGDPRADQYRSDFMYRHRNMNAELVIGVYAGMKSKLARNPATTLK